MQSRGDRLEDEAAADLEDALAALEHLGVRALAEQVEHEVAVHLMRVGQGRQRWWR